MTATVDQHVAQAERMEEASNALAHKILDECVGRDIEVIISALAIVFLNCTEQSADSANVPLEELKQYFKGQFDFYVDHMNVTLTDE